MSAQRLAAYARSLALHLIPFYAVVVALALSASFFIAASVNPLSAIHTLVQGALGNRIAIGNTISDATPLLFTALGAAICFRAGVYNLGGEGQLYLGALAGSAVAIYLHGLSSWELIVVSFVASAGAGAVWALLPALAKILRGTSEILSTLLFNFIGIYLVAYFVARRYGPLHGKGLTFAGSDFVQPGAHLPSLIAGAQANAAFAVGVAIALILAVVITHTTAGFQVRAAGLNPIAARHAGHGDKSVVLGTMLVGGAICGLAGTANVLFQTFLLGADLSPPPGWGYVGIIVALLGGLRPLPIVLAALFFGGLQAGADYTQLTNQTPASIADIVQALTIVLVLAGGVARTALLRRARVAATRQAASAAPATAPDAIAAAGSSPASGSVS